MSFFARMCDSIMRVQTFLMFETNVEISNAAIGIERTLNATRGVLAEHQVAAVGKGEGLFVFALDRRLHRRAQ